MSTEPTDEELQEALAAATSRIDRVEAILPRATDIAKSWNIGARNEAASKTLDVYDLGRASAVTPKAIAMMREAADIVWDAHRPAVSVELRALADRLEKGQSR